MFLHILVSLCAPESIALTDNNATAVLRSLEKPIFLKLWATWCPHCKQLKPTWDELSENENVTKDVIVADVECEANRITCQKFEGDNFPRIFWIDNNNNVIVQYNGERSVNHFISFINKQINYPLIVVRKEEELEVFRENVKEATTFVFNGNIKNVADTAKVMAKEFRHLESNFVLDFSGGDYSLYVINGKDKDDVYKNDWNVNDIAKFIKMNSIPFLVNFTPSVLKHSEIENKAVFIVINESINDDAIKISEFASNSYFVARGNCKNQTWLCRYTSLDINGTSAQYLIFDRKNRIFWVERKGLNTVNDIENWITDVRNKKIKSEGPGTGFFGPLLEQKYNARSLGEPESNVQLYIYVVVFGLAIAFFGHDIIVSLKRRMTKVD